MKMVDLRLPTLLLVACAVACAHVNPDRDENSSKIIEMIANLQHHELSFEEDMKAEMMNYRESLKATQSQKSTTFEVNPEPRDCYELYGNGATLDGIYTIYTDDTYVQVFCDMSNGGWTLIQKRTDHTLDYTQDMYKYANGFGDLAGEHWLGLDAMHMITKTGHWILRFELEDFSGETAWAEYSDFRIDTAPHYRLYFDQDSYQGTAEASDLLYHHAHSFTTRDVDQDGWPDGNCATEHAHMYGGGGFWYGNCGYVTTTGMPYGDDYSIQWYALKGTAALKSVTLKIKLA